MKRSFRTYLFLVLGVFFFCQIAVNLAAARIIRGPYLSNVTKTSIIISWETSKPSGSLVEYGVSEGALDMQAEGPSNVKHHNVALESLEPSTKYRYRIVSGSDVSEESSFHTAVDWIEPFTIAAYGDTRSDRAAHQAVVDSIIEHKPDLVINSGDLVRDGTVLSQWDVFFDTTKELMKSVPYYPVLGNHERNAQYYYDFFSLPAGGGKENEQWYSFDYGNTHFVCLDSNDRRSKEQLAWLEDDLERASKQAQWIVVVFHHPPYSSGSHGSQFATMPNWLNAFEAFGVNLVINGHDHQYERSFRNGIWYIVSGGGGAPLRKVNSKPNPYQVYAESTYHFCRIRIDGPHLTFDMIRPDGSVGDSFVLDESVVVTSATNLPTIWELIKSSGAERGESGVHFGI